MKKFIQALASFAFLLSLFGMWMIFGSLGFARLMVLLGEYVNFTIYFDIAYFIGLGITVVSNFLAIAYCIDPEEPQDK